MVVLFLLVTLIAEVGCAWFIYIFFKDGNWGGVLFVFIIAIVFLLIAAVNLLLSDGDLGSSGG